MDPVSPQFTYTIHDLIQWVGLIGSILGVLWWFQRDRKSHRNDIVEITRWRTNVDRDIGELNDEVKRRERRDGLLMKKLEELCENTQELGNRLLKIETLMEERGKKPGA